MEQGHRTGYGYLQKHGTLSQRRKVWLAGQIRRAAVSIPANLAEGAGRRSQKEFAHFLSNSQGSASELETELIIAHRLGYLDEPTFARLIDQLERIGRLITGLVRQITGGSTFTRSR